MRCAPPEGAARLKRALRPARGGCKWFCGPFAVTVLRARFFLAVQCCCVASAHGLAPCSWDKLPNFWSWVRLHNSGGVGRLPGAPGTPRRAGRAAGLTCLGGIGAAALYSCGGPGAAPRSVLASPARRPTGPTIKAGWLTEATSGRTFWLLTIFLWLTGIVCGR